MTFATPAPGTWAWEPIALEGRVRRVLRLGADGLERANYVAETPGRDCLGR
jgi:hypothetical protein